MFHNMKDQKIIGEQDQSNHRGYGKWKGSIVVEASYLMPFTLILYGIIILIAAVLLVRCLSSQNQFLLTWQEKRYTDSNISEVIYADRESS